MKTLFPLAYARRSPLLSELITVGSPRWVEGNAARTASRQECQRGRLGEMAPLPAFMDIFDHVEDRRKVEKIQIDCEARAQYVRGILLPELNLEYLTKSRNPSTKTRLWETNLVAGDYITSRLLAVSCERITEELAA